MSVMLAVALVVVASVPAAAADDWQALDKAAKQALAKQDYKQAAEASAKAAKGALGALKPDDPRLGYVLLTAGEAHRHAGRFRQAQRYYSYALELAKKRYPHGHQRVSLLITRLAEVREAVRTQPRTPSKPPVAKAPKPQPRAAKPKPKPRPRPKPKPKPRLPDIPGLAVQIVQYGLFRVEGIEPEGGTQLRVTYGDADVGGTGQVSKAKHAELVRTTDRVPSRSGTIFGIAFLVQGDLPGQEVKLVVRELTPEHRVQGSRYKIVMKETDYTVKVGNGRFSLTKFGENPAGRPPGKYTYQVLYRGRKLAERTFTVYVPSGGEGQRDAPGMHRRNRREKEF